MIWKSLLVLVIVSNLTVLLLSLLEYQLRVFRPPGRNDSSAITALTYALLIMLSPRE